MSEFIKHGRHGQLIDRYSCRARDTPDSFDFPADLKVSRSSQQRFNRETTFLKNAPFGKEILQAESTTQRSEVCGRSICHQRDE